MNIDNNNTRADRAQEALRALYEVEDYESSVSDILTDLMHFCDRAGFDFDQRIRTARMHYEAEIGPNPEE